MSLHEHVLSGCGPRPLASYLKALGVLRILSEQADPGARGWWQDDAFHLLTRLDEAALLRFFLHDWQPSGIASPWNKGSGFFAARDKGLDPVERSTAPRFARLRDAIGQARALTEAMERAVQEEKAIKAESNAIKDAAEREALRSDPAYKQRLSRASKECKRLKDELQPECQLRWRGDALRWLRAAVVLDDDGGASFPALLGTGGNDGKLDFTNNAWQRLADLFDLGDPGGAPRPDASARLRSALFGDPVPGLLKGAIGQYAPAASGGPNATTGALADSRLNPWDLPLLLEGGLLFTAGSHRRLLSRAAPKAAAPFAVHAEASGYGSAARSDVGARGEQWMPLWSQPWTAGELRAVLAEGRCQLGKQRSENAVDVARAAARLGVDRGITAFERYGYIERNGKSNYAVPLGRWPVHEQPDPQAPLLDDLEQNDWWPRLRRALSQDNAPASLLLAERQLSDAVLSALAERRPARWEAVLLSLAAVEAQMVRSGAFTVDRRLRPIPPLSPGWIQAVGADRPELRLALSLAGAGADQAASGIPHDSLRVHWLPLDGYRAGAAARFAAESGGRGLRRDPRVVVRGRQPEDDLIALLERRLVEAESAGGRRLPIRARLGTAARPADLEQLLLGSIDLERVLDLARALSALDWEKLEPQHLPPAPRHHGLLPQTWMALRLVHLHAPLDAGRRVPVDPAVLRLLEAGQADRAFEIVRRRLRSSGTDLPFHQVALEPRIARRFAAALAFPITTRTARDFAGQLDPRSNTPEAAHVG